MRTYGFFTLLALLAGVAACNRIPDDGTAPVPISFSCGAQPTVTVKADTTFVSSNLLPENGHFAVYGWDTGAGYLLDGGTGPGEPDFWNGTTPMDVTFHNNDDRGKNNLYDPSVLSDFMDQYWPRSQTPAYCYSFWAYYPYFSGNGVTVQSFSGNADGTVGVIDFQVKSTPAAMVDLCVSDVANDNVYGTTNSDYPGTVALTFHHTLTRVQFQFLASDDAVRDGVTIKLMDAKLLNIYTTGTLTTTYAQRTPAPAFGRAGTTAFDWSAQDDADDFEITVGGTDPVEGTPASHITLQSTPGTLASEDVFLMVPQIMLTSGALTPKQSLYFKWSVDNGSGATTYNATVLLDEAKTGVGHSDNADIDWEANQFVTYTVVIGARPIEFDISARIAPWAPDINGYYPIIS